FFFSSRRRHTRSYGDWSSDVCSSDLNRQGLGDGVAELVVLICVHASFAADPAVIVNDAEVPVLFAGAVTDVTVSVVDCASNSVKIGRASCRERVWSWGGGGAVRRTIK